MSGCKKYRIVITQSVLTEHFVIGAASPEAAEDVAYNGYRQPKGRLASNQWLSDALETVDIEEVPS